MKINTATTLLSQLCIIHITLALPPPSPSPSPFPPLTTTPNTNDDLTNPSPSPLASLLGYSVAALSFLLYTPILIRILRNNSAAQGLPLDTWWLKLVSYTCTAVYSVKNGYPISTYAETLVIGVEAMMVLVIVAFLQIGERVRVRNETRNDEVMEMEEENERRKTTTLLTHVKFSDCSEFLTKATLYTLLLSLSLTIFPPTILDIEQVSSAILGLVALLPQIRHNFRTGSSGDYSPVTASLAAGGCLIRLYTTVELAGEDALLMWSYGLAFGMNGGLYGQILWYGMGVEGKGFGEVMTGDWGRRGVGGWVRVRMEDGVDGCEEEEEEGYVGEGGREDGDGDGCYGGDKEVSEMLEENLLS